MRRSSLPLALALALLCGACGGGGGGGSSFAPPPAPPPAQKPVIHGLTPSGIEAGGEAFSLSVQGAGFLPSSIVRWNGADRPTTFSHESSVAAAISAADIEMIQQAKITVFNPPPGGGTSDEVQFSVFNPLPRIQALSPSSTTACAAGVHLTLSGEGFQPHSVIWAGGIERPTTFVSVRELTTVIPGADLSLASQSGSMGIEVANCVAGGCRVSESFPLAIEKSPLTVLTSSLPAATADKPYLYQLQACGGTDPIQWELAGGNLPGGFQLETDGHLRGTAVSVAEDTSFVFTVRASDSGSPPSSAERELSLLVQRSESGRNDSCPGSVTAISSGTLEASISPYGDIDVYSFLGRAGDVVDFETFALPGSGVDTVAELLDGDCALLAFNDDVSPNRLDSRVTFSLPVSSAYFIRVRDYRGDGRPDFLYGLRLSGAQ